MTWNTLKKNALRIAVYAAFVYGYKYANRKIDQMIEKGI